MGDPQVDNDLDEFFAPTAEPKRSQTDKDLDEFFAPEKQVSATGAFIHHAVPEVLPSAGGWAGAGAGALAGGELFAPAGPWAAFGGSLAGGAAGFFLGSTAVHQAQNWVVSKLPDSWQSVFGQDEETRRQEEKEYPKSSAFGGIAPFALTMSPMNAAKKVLAPNATMMQRLANNPATARAVSGLVFGGTELGSELIHGESPDWAKTMISGGFGAFFSRPNMIGRRLTEYGERATGLVARREARLVAADQVYEMGHFRVPVKGQPRTETAQETAKTEAQPPAQEAAATPPPPPHPGVTQKEWNETILGTGATRGGADEPLPTVNSARDLKVFGEGNTQAVYLGTQQKNPVADLAAQQAARAERAVIGPALPAPDVREVARQMEPEIFAHYDELQARRAELQAWISEVGPDDAPVARQHLAATDAELAEVSPQIAAAHRRAADAIGTATVEHAPTTETVAPGARPIAEQRAAIASDVESRLIAAGRPAEEARLAGQLVASQKITRAARFRGALGTAEELHAREGADIRGPDGRRQGAEPVHQTERTGSLPVPPPQAKTADQMWSELSANRQDRKSTGQVATGYNDFQTKSGAAVRPKASQQWELGNTVDVGFVKNLMIGEANPDGTFTLMAKPDAQGMSQTYNAKPHGGLIKEGKIDFREAAQKLLPQPIAPQRPQRPIVTTYDVVSGANSSKDPNGPVYVDRRIPQFSPELKDRNGQPADLHKYLAIHEIDEAKAMARGMSYDDAHTKIATPAERDAVESDGVSWDGYTKEMDGYLAKIEHEKAENPPPDTHVDPQDAIGHHKAENKAQTEVSQPKPRTIPAFGYQSKTGWYTSNMIENAEAYRAAAKKRREERGGGGGKVYTSTAAMERAKGRTAADIRAEQAEVSAKFDQGMADNNIAAEEVPVKVREIALQSMKGGMQPIDALDYATLKFEREAILLENEDSRLVAEGIIDAEESNDPAIWDIPFETGDPSAHGGGEISGQQAEAGTAIGKPAREDGEVGRGTEGSPGEGGAHAGEVERELVSELLQRIKARGHGLFAQREAEGQTSLPGTEHALDADMAQRAADARLMASKDQKPLDFGLFGDDAAQKELFQRDAAPTYYSVVARTIENAKQEKASADQWLGMLKNAPGVKSEEMEWLGLADWLKEQKGAVTKQKIADYIRANSIEVKEVEKSERRTSETGDDELASRSPTKFGAYTLPGGENYRELLLTLPQKQTGDYVALSEARRAHADAAYQVRLIAEEKGTISPEWQAAKQSYADAGRRVDELTEEVNRAPQPYKSSHFNEPNILAHVRFNDRTIDGKKTLFIEEVQSDWHQAGRRKGYQGDKVGLPEGAEVYQPDPENYPNAWEWKAPGDTVSSPRFHAENAEEARRVATENWQRSNAAVPDAPFKTTWPELSLKRMVRYAAEHGYEQIAWTPGDVQAERYDLSKQVESIATEREADGKYKVEIYHKGARPRWDGEGSPDTYEKSANELADFVGKDLADKIVAHHEPSEERYFGRKVWDGDNLKIGGEGMKSFYDRELVNVANKLGKKFGAKVEGAKLPGGNEGWTIKHDPDQGIWTVYDAQGNWESERRSESDARKYLAHSTDVHALKISPQLRDAAVEHGFPLFQSARGKIDLNPTNVLGRYGIGVEGVKPIMTMLKAQNASTFIHESGHQFLAEMMRDSLHPLAPEDLKADARTTISELGLKNADELNERTAKGDFTDKARKAHEQFAKWFEQYFWEGTAPSPELASVFARFERWMLDIYATVKDIFKGKEVPLNDNMRRVFDRMLAEHPNPQRTVIASDIERGPTLADIHAADAVHAEPHERLAVADRIGAETARVIEDHPEAINAVEAKIAAADAEAAKSTGAEHGGEAGAGAAVKREMEPGGGVAEPDTARGGTNQEPGTVGKRGTEPAAESGAGAEPASSQSDAGRSVGDTIAPQPATVFGPRETGLVGKDGNIRAENITSSEQFIKAIDESSERLIEQGKTTSGTATMSQMIDLAEDIDVSPSTITEAKLGSMFGGLHNLGPKIWALRGAIKNSADVVNRLTNIAAETPTPENLAAMAEAMARHDMMQTTLSGVTTAMGRTQGMAFRNMEGWQKAKDIGEFVKNAVGKPLYQLEMLAKMGARLDTPAKVSKFIRDAQKRSFGGMILEYWVNGLISGLPTHVTYVVGNTISALYKAVPETAAAAAVGAVRRSLGREGPTVKIGEVGAQLRGLGRGLAGGVQGAVEAADTGLTTLLPGETARASTPYQGDTGLTVARNMTNDPVTWREVGGQMFGVAQGLKDGIIAGAELIRAGGITGAPIIGFARSPGGQIGDLAVRGVRFLPGLIPGGTMIRLPGRGVAVIHSFFRGTIFSMEKSAMAFRIADEEVLAGKIPESARAARMAEIYRNPSEEMMEEIAGRQRSVEEAARTEATETTLMGHGSEFVRQLSKLTNTKFLGFQWLKFVDPFVHIAGNIIDQAIVQRTPVGLLSPELRADLMGHNGTIAADKAAARMLLGTAVGITFGTLAGEGYITGSGPKDPAKAATWRQAGYQAHSVTIGDLNFDIHRLGPMGMLAGIAADLYDVAHHASEGEIMTAAAHLQHAIAQNILDESMMRGPADLIKAIQDPDRYGENYIKNMISSFVPFSVGMGSVARTVDPYSRQARTVMDAIKNKIPGLSESLLPRRDIWGEPLPNPEALVAKGLTAIYIKKISSDPVNIELNRLGFGVNKIERKIRNVDLTDQEYDDFSRIAGRTTKMQLNHVVISPYFQSKDDETKRHIITDLITKTRENARNMVMGMHRHIPADAAQARKDRFKENKGKPLP